MGSKVMRPSAGADEGAAEGGDVKVSAEISVTPQILAEAFCGMDDEAQAQVFIEVARIAKERWEPDGGNIGMQWAALCRHLRTCACSTEEAREMVATIAS